MVIDAMNSVCESIPDPDDPINGVPTVNYIYICANFDVLLVHQCVCVSGTENSAN